MVDFTLSSEASPRGKPVSFAQQRKCVRSQKRGYPGSASHLRRHTERSQT